MKITTKPKASDMRKKRVAANCRVSTLLDAQEDSLETQTAYYKSYIEAHPAWEFAGIYADKKTGTDSENRAGFQQMIDKACSGGIDTIAEIIARRTGIRTGTAIAAAGILTCLSAALVYDFQAVLIGIVVTALNGILLNLAVHLKTWLHSFRESGLSEVPVLK